MDLDPALRQRIQEIVDSEPVVLFMKGHRDAPRCGFSATVCQILDRLIPDYATVDVLEDPELRDGVKHYSSWPTIPQLYVRGSFVGGCDIVQEMLEEGTLAEALGVDAPATSSPQIAVTEAAAEALHTLAADAGERTLHLAIDARFQNGLFFGPSEPGEICVEANGVRIFMDPFTAARADGLVLDAVATADGPGFQIQNPNAPAPRVGQMSVQELKRRLDADEELALFDVRTPEERAIASIEGARLLDESSATLIERMDRDTLIVFHCHHGGRSQAACEHFAALGFTNIHNVVGGIDAWSLEIDSDVPRY